MSRFKTFIIGVVLGGLLTGGVSYAADKIVLEVALPKISYLLDGKKLQLGSGDGNKEGTFMSNGEELPITILYKGTSYVPLRHLAKALDKEVRWNAQNLTVNLITAEDIPFEKVEYTDSPAVVQAWIDRSLNKELGQSMTYEGDTFVLVTRGEKSTGGYEVKVGSVKKYLEGVVVQVHMTDPPKGAIVFEALTYEYSLIRIRGETHGSIAIKDGDGASVPSLVGMPYLPPIESETDSIVLFALQRDDNEWVITGAAQSFEGMVYYGLIDEFDTKYMEGSIQALSSAPDWGVFTLKIDRDQVKLRSSVVIQTISPKDGSISEAAALILTEDVDLQQK